MSSIDDLVALRQRSIDSFIVNGGKRKDAAFYGEQEAVSFTSDAALLTHPLYSISIENNTTAMQRSLESTIVNATSSKLAVDALQLSKVQYYGSRDNKYGTSCISFDQEGVLFACGGSNGIIKVYDFDECYAASNLRKQTLQPVVSLDTRRDVTCIAWSHLSPDCIAVSYLYRPDIQVFDLSDVGDTHNSNNNTANNTNNMHSTNNTHSTSSANYLSSSNSEPTQTLNADGKGRGGHNVVLYWHSVKYTTATNNNTNTHTHNTNTTNTTAALHRRESEGVVAGSVTGYVRYWHASSTSGGGKSCLWNVMADPQRTSLTATAVVALQAMHSNAYTSGYSNASTTAHTNTKHTNSSNTTHTTHTTHTNNTKTIHTNNTHTTHTTHTTLTLLLAATAQGVITLWDLTTLKPASFGSVQPEPRCVRRVEYTNNLLLYEGRVLIGVTPVQYVYCMHCGENSCGTSSIVCSDKCNTAHIEVWRNNSSVKSSRGISTSTSASANNTTTNIVIDSNILLTDSQGCVYTVDLNTEGVVASSAHSRGAHYETSPLAAPTSKLLSGNNPANPVVLSYEQLRQELVAAEVTQRDQGGHTLRAVLPAVVPAWHSHLHHRTHHNKHHTPHTTTHQNSAQLYNTLTHNNTTYNNTNNNTTEHPRATGDTAIITVPYGVSGSVLSTYDISHTAPLSVYPYSHNLHGTCSVSGKDHDPYTGIVRSNMRRTETISTTLPGFIMSAEPGAYEIVTSIDLQSYLCASVSSSGVFAKCSSVEFDWSLSGVDMLCFGSSGSGTNGSTSSGGSSVSVYCNGAPYPHTTSSNTVEGMSMHRIYLHTPYVGPDVLDGHPRVFLRAALLPSGRTATYNTSYNTFASTNNPTIYTNTAHTNHTTLPLHHNTRLTHAITALTAHPLYPVLVAGTRNDDVILLNPSAAPCASDTVQEPHPCYDTINTSTNSTATSHTNTTDHTQTVCTEEMVAARLRTRALHRVGLALPRYDTESSVGSGVACSVEDEVNSISVSYIVDSITQETDALTNTLTNTADSGDVCGGDSSDDDCSIVQLREQYNVDPSVLTAAQLARVHNTTDDSDNNNNTIYTDNNTHEVLNSPLHKARQQMLRARAKHNNNSTTDSSIDGVLPDLGVLGGSSGAGGTSGSSGVSGGSSSVSASTGNSASGGSSGTIVTDDTSTTVTSSGGVCGSSALHTALHTLPVPGRLTSLSAIHSSFHAKKHTNSTSTANNTNNSSTTNNTNSSTANNKSISSINTTQTQSGEQQVSKKAKLLGLFAPQSAVARSAVGGKSGIGISGSIGISSSVGKSGVVSGIKSGGSGSNNSSTSTNTTNTSIGGNSNRNALSKLLVPKSALPAHTTNNTTTNTTTSTAINTTNTIHTNNTGTTTNTNNTIHTSNTTNHTTSTIGNKRPLTTTTTTVSEHSESKPKAVNNILNFFSVHKK